MSQPKRKIFCQVDGFAKDEHKSLPMGGRAAGAALSADAVVWLVNSLHILQSLSFVRPVQPVLASIILQLRLKIEPFRGLTIDWDRHTCPHTPRPRLIRHEVSGLVLLPAGSCPSFPLMQKWQENS